MRWLLPIELDTGVLEELKYEKRLNPSAGKAGRPKKPQTSFVEKRPAAGRPIGSKTKPETPQPILKRKFRKRRGEQSPPESESDEPSGTPSTRSTSSTTRSRTPSLATSPRSPSLATSPPAPPSPTSLVAGPST